MTESGFAYADIVVLALVAVFVLLRLRSTLGKHVDLPEAPLPRAEPSSPRRQQEADIITTPSLTAEDETEEEQLVAATAKGLPAAIRTIKKLDPSFRLTDFMNGAKTAFEMVLEAFSKADRKSLKFLLGQEMFDEFMQAIKDLKAKQLTRETTLIAIRSADLAAAEHDGSIIRLTVRFVSDQVTLVRDKQGQIVEGNPSAIDHVEDVWVFERDTRQPDPNWKLVATNEA